MSTIKFDPEILKKTPGPGVPAGLAAANAGMTLPPAWYYFLIGLFVGLSTALLVGVTGWPRGEAFGFWPVVVAVSRAVGWGLGMGALTGIVLSLIALVKDWIYELALFVREWRWTAKDREEAKAESQAQVRVLELSSGFRLDYVAILLIVTAWLHGERYTREVVSAAEDKLDGVLKFCTPKEWNEVMATMDLIGLRTGQKLKVDDLDFEQAISIWRAKVIPEKGGLRVNGSLVGGKPVAEKKGGKKK